MTCHIGVMPVPAATSPIWEVALRRYSKRLATGPKKVAWSPGSIRASCEENWPCGYLRTSNSKKPLAFLSIEIGEYGR